MAKIDHNTDTRIRGQFAKMAIFVDLNQPLISRIKIDGRIQKVEYESLPVVCFGCGKYGHHRDSCVYSSNKGKSPMDLEKSPMGTKVHLRRELRFPHKRRGMRGMGL